MSEAILYLIPTTLADQTAAQVLSPQVLDVVANTDCFLVENLRTARRFISGLKLGKVIDSLHFQELHKDTPDEDWQPFAHQKMLQEGQNIGIISEAGCPGVADPGAKAVAWAHRNGLRVVPLVGPSSILLALMGSGFNGQSFCFHGYLPIEAQARAKFIKQMEKEMVQTGRTQLFMETPYRNKKLLEDVLQQASPNTLLSVAAGITSEQEIIQTKTVAQWRKTTLNIDKIPAIFSFGKTV
ncbi:16S rRNA (cytidine1402-2'-O)-methyltransferase [Flexibacter flexilis DSM 6793]|uniref:16S rRNA (Cytidine1402-2'-O)-methyltransferase n=1 Tax=Flexibacter flexilis DSM 6793 TaxID=927664 RepID=A0A1I1J9P7_9BACT|nr:SAM-dependent methyltransferase [Flexibacter flexilis]SFC43328.1 16S rRNA (cytidine1402-2'-O)-methyltransferase [Flexibacter flexilis DSM 6793]